MRAPDFWASDNALAKLLSPLARLYGAVTARRLQRGTRLRLPIPVICIGNLSVGGTGKTPVAEAVARALLARDQRPHFLSRGYGGSEEGPVLVDSESHHASQVGDEPLLLSQIAPAWVARDRALGGKAACEAGASHLVMDDGFQNPSLAKDLSLIVVDGRVGFGNGRVLPAGPLRESVEAGLSRASAIVLIGKDEHRIAEQADGLPVLHADLVAAPQAAQLAGKDVLAFAGIGRPGKFFDTLREIGAHLTEAVSFADHHPYSRKEVELLLGQADLSGAIPVTTAKDAVRLPTDLRKRVAIVDIALRWRDPAALDLLLDRLR